MKKLLSVLLCLLLGVLLSVGLASCDEGNTPNEDGTPPTTCQHRDADDDSLCDKCSESYTDGTDSTPPAHTHTWGEWSVTTPATCQTKGVETRSCSCGESATMEIPATGIHSYNSEDICIVCENTYMDLGIKFSLQGNAYTVTDYTGNAAEVIIPSKYKGVAVTSIGEEAFRYCSGLTSITIPNSVTYIHFFAFDGCSGLTSITIPSSITYIADNAFSGCSELTNITLPNSVTSIGSFAFYGCSGLTSITIPSSVTYIGSSAFSGCSGLTSITVDSGNTKYHSADNCLIETTSKTLIAGFKNSIIPTDGSVTSIDYFAFYGCSGLTSITIPNSVTSIGRSAFQGCSGLTGITIPDSVTSIGSYAFYGCSGLTSITIPSSITSIGSSAFSGCSGLTSITVDSGNTKYHSADNCLIETASKTLIAGFKNSILPTDGSVTSIGSFAFYGCSGLTSITIPSSVTSIGSYAFRGCSGLTSIIIPEGVTSIGDDAFSGCSGLTSITVASGNTKYHSAENCLIETASKTLVLGCKNSVIPSNGSVTSIGDRAFEGCSGLTSITIPSSVTSIGMYAFYGCSNLESITLPFVGATLSSTKNTHFGYIFGASSYSDNNNYVPASLTTVVITGGTSIKSSAFYNCSGLTSITIPSSVTSISSYAFKDCSGLESITVASGNAKYHSTGNCLIETASKTLVFGCKNSVIPSDGSVTSIGSYAFRGCSGLTSITIPDSVISIGSYAFDDCRGIIQTENGVSYVDKWVIDCDTSVTSVTLRANTVGIGPNAFHSCRGLSSITIPNSVTSIGDSAFQDCRNLTSINIPSNVTYIGSYAFDDCRGIIQTENGVSYIDKWVIDCDASVTSVTLRANTVGIMDGAFADYNKLTSITIPEGVTYIGSHAFYDCSGLTSIKYRGTVEQWNGITKGDYWNDNTGDYTITYNYTGE